MKIATLAGVYVGKIGTLPGESRPSAIAKTACTGSVRVGGMGLAGDEHGDPRVHGGLDKAVHLFPLGHYARLAAAFPDATHLVAGGLGENVSADGLDESTICIGDRHAIGSVVLEVSQPRTPCWKIDARCGVEGVTAYIAEHGIAGWYYRVITPGELGVGDAVVRVARPAGAVTLADYWRVINAARPPLDELARVAHAPGLAADKRERLLDRLARLATLGVPPP